MPMDDELSTLPALLVSDFLTAYYSILSNKPQEWLNMIEKVKAKETISLLPL
jgi:hypothetical protein